MRAFKLLAIASLIMMGLSAFCMGPLNKFGVADVQQITFNDPIQVAGVTLPKGDYRVEHTMQGEEHIMVFTQLKAKSPVTAKAKCQLVKLEAKSDRTQVLYIHPDPNTHVLQELIFKGETAKHVF